MRGLKGKRVLITGGASGIGLETAKRFLAEEAKVVILDQDGHAVERVKKEIPTLSGFLIADVLDHEAVKDAFTELEKIFHDLDILINNAGISIRHPFLDVTPEEWQRVISVNLTGVFFVAQQAA
jgi:NAD(P)-dependent dehydrogenase (short-subunit alcohol dehydrogenase family)